MVECKKNDKKIYRDLRCPYCRAKWFEEYIFKGRIRIKCRNCKRIITMVFKSAQNIIEYQDIKDYLKISKKGG